MWTRLVTLACLATGLLAAPERPEAGLSCPRSQGLFSHPTDCHLFLHCDHDHPYVKECPANLHFNAKLMVCDWPENAGCTGGAPTDPPPPDTDPEPGMECDCECCLEPNADDCTTYYICKDGKAWKASCAQGLVFNPNIDNCDLASNYKCEVKSTTPKPVTTKAPTTPKPTTTTTTTTTTTVAPKPDFDCPTSNGLFPNPADCHTFYHCSNGHAYLKDCPANLEFNPTLLVCDWPENAGCNGKPTASPQPPAPTNPTPSDFDCPTSNGLFPNPLDCHTFYHCSNGYSYLKDCPANLEFNPKLLVCDWPKDAGCSVQPTSSPKPKSTTPSGFDCPTSNGLFPNPADCHTFYHCSNGHAYLKDCPANLEFNPTLLVCDWPENSGCNGKPTTSPQPAPTNPTPSDFDCPTSNGLFPNPLDCHTFYHCSNGYSYLKDCPANLEFNPKLLVCDWPKDAGCSVQPTSSPKPKSTTPSGFDCPTSNGLFPNPTDCHSFYQCSNGHAYLMNCPANLEFNPTLLVCDWPEHAGCGGKTTLKPTTAKPTTPKPGPDFDCPSDGLFPNPTDCHTFYHCSNGHAYLKDCPANLEFNPTLLVCDWPDNAGCGGKTTLPPKPTSGPTPKPTPNPDIICPNETCVCRVPDPKDCACFYQCQRGDAYKECCSPGLHFNKDTEVCDLPENVDCDPVTPAPPSTTTTVPAPVTTTQKPTPTEAPTCTFPCTKSDGQYGNPLNCGTYFECTGGQATIRYCPSDKHFNTGTNSCDAPETAGCCEL